MIKMKDKNKVFSQGIRSRVRILWNIVSLTMFLYAVPSYASLTTNRVDTSILCSVGDSLKGFYFRNLRI